MAIFAGMEKEVPKELLAAEAHYIKTGFAHFEYLGEYKGHDAWDLILHTQAATGYPSVYLWKAGEITRLDGEDSLLVVSLLK